MARPVRADRDTVAATTRTLRLTTPERTALDGLVTRRQGELAESGGLVSAASFVRALIRAEAQRCGLLPAAVSSGAESGNAPVPTATPSPTATPGPKPKPKAAKSPDTARADAVRATFEVYRTRSDAKSQRKVAVAAGIPQSLISDFASGKRPLTPARVEALAEWLAKQ